MRQGSTHVSMQVAPSPPPPRLRSVLVPVPQQEPKKTVSIPAVSIAFTSDSAHHAQVASICSSTEVSVRSRDLHNTCLHPACCLPSTCSDATGAILVTDDQPAVVITGDKTDPQLDPWQAWSAADLAAAGRLQEVDCARRQDGRQPGRRVLPLPQRTHWSRSPVHIAGTR